MPKKSKERMQEEALTRQMFAKRLKYAMSFRKMTNTDISNQLKDLNVPMSKSQISQFLNGRFLPDEKRVSLWSKILRVNPYWLMGFGSDDEIMVIPTAEEEARDFNELCKLYSRMHPDQRKLLLAIAKEFMYPYDNPQVTIVPKDAEIKIDYNKTVD